MKVLLIGEYSRLHLTLAEGLRSLGHEVVVASDGDGFKNYPRDIDISRKSSGLTDTVSGMMSVSKIFSDFKGYDIVQLINPCFTTYNSRFNIQLYNQLRKNNKKVFLGAFGDDYYWVKACLDKIYSYSEFFIGDAPTNLEFNKGLIEKWIGTPREKANKQIAASCAGIVSCIYEYYKAYAPQFGSKSVYIPLPVNVKDIEFQPITEVPEKVNFFIGINRIRHEFKGTDVMERALNKIAAKYHDKAIITRVESVSYEEYKRLMSSAHVVLDQLYSHSPAMNALLAMAQGKIVVGGGDEDMYKLIGEKDNHPIIDVYPTEEDVFSKLEWLIVNKEQLPTLSVGSRKFVENHHDFMKVIRQYVDFWQK